MDKLGSVCGHITRISPLMRHKVGDDPEIAAEPADLFITHKRDLKQIDLVIIDVGSQIIRDIDRLMKCPVAFPVCIAKIQHNRNYRISLFCRQFCPVCSAFITDHAQGHVFVVPGLMLKPKKSYPDLLFRISGCLQKLANIPFLLMDLPVCLVHGIRRDIRQSIRVNNRSAVKEQPVHDIRENVVIRCQCFFSNVFFSQSVPPYGHRWCRENTGRARTETDFHLSRFESASLQVIKF